VLTEFALAHIGLLGVSMPEDLQLCAARFYGMVTLWLNRAAGQ
jgi:hypothetical protein